MINLKTLSGNNHIKEIIKNRFFHAYIIEGAEGSGRHTLCDLLACSMVCVSGEKPCGHCNQCEKFLSGNHPDIVHIDANSRVIEVREFLKTTNLAPNDGGRKVYIIYEADKLNAKSQNVLLKPLEEPSKHTCFILLCSAKEGLLPTVRSRCVTLSMMPVEENEIIAFLKKKYPDSELDKIKNASFLSGGYIGNAIRNIEQAENLLLEKCEEFYQAFQQNNFSKMIENLNFKQRNEMKDFVSAIKSYFQKKLKAVTEENLKLENKLGDIVAEHLEICTALEQIELNMDYNININLWSTYIIKQCSERKFRNT